MADTGWSVAQECPQCGGTVVLEESDRVLCCPYCHVRFHLAFDGPPRLTFPTNGNREEDLVHVPYWRFRGQVFSCVPYEIKSGLLDMTSRALDLDFAPQTLGIRPQAMKLRYASRESPGRFLKTGVALDTALSDCQRIHNALYQTPALHQAFIGETVSLVYLPIAVRDGLYDAVTDRRIGPLPDREIGFDSLVDSNGSIGIVFHPTVCPQCGWDLDPEPDSLAIPCRNCQSFWAATDGRLEPLEFRVHPADFEPEIHLPFWCIRPKVRGIELESYADLVRLGNLPKVVRPEDEKVPVHLWTPAFKVHPSAYLRIAKTVTIAAPEIEVCDRIPVGEAHPINLPPTEAAESLKILMADFARPKRQFFPRLEEIEVEAATTQLVYVPFEGTGGELHNRSLRTCIPRNLLKYGRNL